MGAQFRQRLAPERGVGGAACLGSPIRPRSGHGPLTTVVYKVQMTPVDRSDAQMSSPVTAKHLQSGLQLSSRSREVQPGLLTCPPLPARPPASRTLVQDERGRVDHDACVQHLRVGRQGAGNRAGSDRRGGAGLKEGGVRRDWGGAE